MHTFAILLSIPLLRNADTPVPVEPPSYSNISMYQVYGTPRNIRWDLYKFYAHQGGDINDAYTWRGVECTAGAVTSIVAPQCSMALKIAFLPPTVQFFHYRQPRVDGTYSVRYLPRDLRYMYIRFSCPDVFYEHLDNGILDTAYLPQYSEEIHICLRMQIWHTVNITTLPPNLRLLQLWSSSHIHRVVVNNASLPPGLVAIQILKEKRKEKISVLSCSSDQADSRVWAYRPQQRLGDRFVPPQLLVEGAYFRTYDSKWAEISREMGAPEQMIANALLAYAD